jgi:tyrosyl-tRNA synthetase
LPFLRAFANLKKLENNPKKMKIDNKTILERGTVDVIVREELEKKLNSGKKLRVKLGIDPSGADLHLGHMVVIKKLKEFQDAGHQIQLLFGNFTGQIGDPTDKLNSRKPKTQEELEKNAKKYIKQAGKILDTTKVDVVWNANWLKKLDFADVVKLAQVFTVHQMLERDMYQERIKKNHPIYMHEFLYPLMQGYDSVALESDLELGGTDQTFNLLAGRTIQKAYGQTPQSVLTVPLLVGTDGKEKMGKSLDNYIGVIESPKEMFGKIMSIPDDLIINYFELTTNVSLEGITKIEKSMKEGENPRNVKVNLAKEIVNLYHDKQAADNAEKEFIEIFANKGLPDKIEEKSLKGTNWQVVELLLETGLTSSKGEARRLIQGGGVRVKGEKVPDIEHKIDISKQTLIQVGKRKFLKVTGK